MYKVLLVDDESLVRDAISANINWGGLGFSLVGSCKNGKEAMEYIMEHPIDLLLTDICMPYMDGMELCKFVSEEYPDVRIVIFSGYDEFEYAKKAMKYKVEEYLLKPVTAFELSSVLTNLKEKMNKSKETNEKINMLKESYQKNLPIRKAEILYNLMLSNKMEEEHQKDLEEIDIMFHASDFKVALIEIDLYSMMYETDLAMKQQSALMSFMVFNITEEIISEVEGSVVFQGSDNKTFIIFQTNHKKEFDQIINKACQRIQKEVLNLMKLEITIGISRYVHSLKQLYLSYREVIEAVEYKYVLGGGKIIDMELIKQKQAKSITIDNHIKDLILNIKMNSKKEIDQIFNKIISEFQSFYLNKQTIYLYLQQIIVAVNKALKLADLIDDPVFIKEEILIQTISNKKLLRGAMDCLKDYCCAAAAQLENQKDGNGKRQALLALDYIENHYGDCEISLNSVCTYLSISPSHFSTIFKNYTGETFVEALIKKRMEKAKQLLENTDLKNYEIAEKVGFSDPHYFSISFKKATGKAPKEYARERR